jgi:hypothetical protein
MTIAVKTARTMPAMEISQSTSAMELVRLDTKKNPIRMKPKKSAKTTAQKPITELFIVSPPSAPIVRSKYKKTTKKVRLLKPDLVSET